MFEKSESSEPKENPKPAGESPPTTTDSANEGKSKSRKRSTAKPPDKVNVPTDSQDSTESDPTPKSTRNWNDLLKKWLKELNLNQKLTLLLSIIAILLTILTTVRDVRRESRQEELQITQEAMRAIQSTQEAARATFEAEAQITGEAIDEAQNDLRGTQVAIEQAQLNLEQDQQDIAAAQATAQASLLSLYERLALPYIEAVKAPEPILISETHPRDLGNGVLYDEIIGSVNFTIANNGGGQTQLISVDLIGGTAENELQWELQRVDISSDEDVLLPYNMPGQSAFSFVFLLSGKFEDSVTTDQLGISVVNEIVEASDESDHYLQFKFSNIESLVIPLDLTLDPSLFLEKTSRPELIPITKFDAPSSVCFDTNGVQVEIDAIFSYQGASQLQEGSHDFAFTQDKLESSCWSLPAGLYSVTYSLGQSQPDTRILITVEPNIIQTIELEIIFPTRAPTPMPVDIEPPAANISEPRLISSWVRGIILLTTLLILLKFAFPWVRVRTFSPPPDVYLGVFYQDRLYPSDTFSLRSVGLEKRTSKIVVGGDKKKSHIYIEGLLPREFTVSRQDDGILLTVINYTRHTFVESLEVQTSHPDIFLIFDRDKNRLLKGRNAFHSNWKKI